MFVLFLAAGIVTGRLLNILIYRLPPRPPRGAACRCRRGRFAVADLVPSLKQLCFVGRCRYCGAGLAARDTAVEWLTAALFAWCFLAWGSGGAAAAAFVSFLVLVAVIDLDHRLILNQVLVWMAVCGVALQFFCDPLTAPSGAGRDGAGWLPLLAGALSGGGPLLAVAWFGRGAMGDGDVKLAAVLGLWLGWQHALLTVLLAFLLGGAAGVLLLALRLKSRRDYIPFGPFLTLAALICARYGDGILAWYLG